MSTDLAIIFPLEWMEDGTPFNPETGEIYDPTDQAVIDYTLAHNDADTIKAFRVDSVESAEWALQKRGDVEAEIVALEAQREAITRNINNLINQRRRRLAWWDWRFLDDLVTFARSQLKKTKTAQFVHGKVSFRSSKGSRAILFDDQALAFVRRWAPDKIKVVESVNLTAIDAAIKAANEATESTDYDAPPFVASTGPKETVTVETGLPISGPKSQKEITES